MQPRGGEHDAVSAPTLHELAALGWETIEGFDETFGPDGTLGRDADTDPVLTHRLRSALVELNPEVPLDRLERAIDELTQSRAAMDPVRANREVHYLLRDGFPVDVELPDGRSEPVRVRFVDWDDPEANDWLAVSEFWIRGDLYLRRADMVLFVNGIPLVLMEFKAPHVNVKAAYDGNLSDYRDVVPHLFWFNGFVVLSNGSDTKVGSTYAGWEYFAEWKKINDEGEQGLVSLETALRATCAPSRVLDLLANFVAYVEMPGGLVKALAKNHQFLGVNNTIDAIREAKERDGRLGVFWHTQGSGKSLSMLWFTQKVLRTMPGNWTFVMVTDRKELDHQLYETFVDADAVTTGTNVHAETSAHLRELLSVDHRYVFTLIHKFIPAEPDAEMPVLSDRDDIVVITDEAHRSQYDTLAMNMRTALPNASFLGFTGTPLIDDEEELTREVFGDYVSVYNFRDSIVDKATVPLYYENRIPELQLTNKDFDTELEALLDEAALDPDQEQAVARQFGRQYHLITRLERLETIADNVVEHFVNRGFPGKAMYVAIDKATAVRMYDLVDERWNDKLKQLEAQLADTPPLERPHLESQIEFMRTTERAVVVSQAQGEMAYMAELGLDIAPHRRKMNDEDLDSRFKDPVDPFRLVFVCAMWMTGFDAPACSTMYLDKPMRNHTLMQTIARANRVFAGKDNGLIVDYVGVFRNLEAALATYATDRTGEIDTPIRDKDELVSNLETTLAEAAEFLAGHDIDLGELEQASGFEFVALQASAAEALLIDDDTRRGFMQVATAARNAFKALLPDPAAQACTSRVAAIRSIAKKLASGIDPPDIGEVMDSVSELLDRSVGAQEYLIRVLGDPQQLVDLSEIDFEQLALQFAKNKRTVANRVQQELQKRLLQAVEQNPTRIDLAEKFQALIDDYNAGTHNIDEILRRLKELSDQLSDEEQRSVREGLNEAELAIFDLLTKPDPELTPAERDQVRKAARQLLEAVTDRLVLDWQRHSQTRSAVEVTIGQTLDSELPDPYDEDLLNRKVDAIFAHICNSYGDDGTSPYNTLEPAPIIPPSTPRTLSDLDSVSEIDEEFLDRCKHDPVLFAELMHHLLGANTIWMTPTADLVNDPDAEDRLLEFKQTARWNINEERKDKRMEEVVAKTVAGFLNAEGGTLLIGVDDNGHPVGLDHDFALVKPTNRDGYVNWLDTMLQHALGHSGSHRVQIRFDVIDDHDICRIDVPASSRPIWATKDDKPVLYERRNNSTRIVPDDETEAFLAERFPNTVAVSA